MSSLVPDDDTRIESTEQLTAWLAAGAKPRERWVIGTEHEKFGWWPDVGAPVTFEGPRGIEALLEELATRGWTPTREGKDIIALARGRATITLEPAGQLELSGAPLRTLEETAAELEAHLSELAEVSAPLGLIWSGLGVAPTGNPATWPRVPKARYGIMRRYLPTRGPLALWMMHGTCSIQANYDFADEADAFTMLRVALFLQPLVTAAFANSPVIEGRLVPERSYRARIWEGTDPDRFEFPERLLARDAGYADYVAWALEVPMFFLVRDGAFHDCAGMRFGDFVRHGFAGHHATMGDFVMHLSTLFPDARLKQHLEVRGADMGDRASVVAMPALHAGLFYDKPTLAECDTLFADLDYAALWDYRRRVATEGLAGRYGGRSGQDWLLEVLKLARQGLGRWEPAATRFLDGLSGRVAEGRCPADDVRDHWDGDVGALYARARIA